MFLSIKALFLFYIRALPHFMSLTFCFLLYLGVISALPLCIDTCVLSSPIDILFVVICFTLRKCYYIILFPGKLRYWYIILFPGKLRYWLGHSFPLTYWSRLVRKDLLKSVIRSPSEVIGSLRSWHHFFYFSFLLLAFLMSICPS